MAQPPFYPQIFSLRLVRQSARIGGVSQCLSEFFAPIFFDEQIKIFLHSGQFFIDYLSISHIINE